MRMEILEAIFWCIWIIVVIAAFLVYVKKDSP